MTFPPSLLPSVGDGQVHLRRQADPPDRRLQEPLRAGDGAREEAPGAGEPSGPAGVAGGEVREGAGAATRRVPEGTGGPGSGGETFEECHCCNETTGSRRRSEFGTRGKRLGVPVAASAATPAAVVDGDDDDDAAERRVTSTGRDAAVGTEKIVSRWVLLFQHVLLVDHGHDHRTRNAKDELTTIYIARMCFLLYFVREGLYTFVNCVSLFLPRMEKKTWKKKPRVN